LKKYLFDFYDYQKYNTRYRNNSVDEIQRVENTQNYDKLQVAAPVSAVELVTVGGMGYKETEKNLIDEKGQFAAIAPENGSYPIYIFLNDIHIYEYVNKLMSVHNIFKNYTFY
jgi:hypothetical protein